MHCLIAFFFHYFSTEIDNKKEHLLNYWQKEIKVNVYAYVRIRNRIILIVLLLLLIVIIYDAPISFVLTPFSSSTSGSSKCAPLLPNIMLQMRSNTKPAHMQGME